jgi:hypothetical protein
LFLTFSAFSGKLTTAQIEEWRTALAKQPTARLLVDIVEAFRSAVAAIGAGKVSLSVLWIWFIF